MSKPQLSIGAAESQSNASNCPEEQWTGHFYQTNDFKMYCWKIVPCANREPHDTIKCPYAHPGESNVRRDPRIYKYSPEACPATQQKNGKCARGAACPLAHNVFERWLHPQRFRTQMCRDGADCPRRYSTCFFAHTDDELRVVPDLSLSSSSSPSAPPPCTSSGAKRSSSSSSTSGFTTPESPALSRCSSSVSSSSSRASVSQATASPLSSVSRHSSFEEHGRLAAAFAAQNSAILAGSGAAAAHSGAKRPGGALAGRAGGNPLSPQPGALSGLVSGPQAGAASEPSFMSGSQSGLAWQKNSWGNHSLAPGSNAAVLGARLKQQLELQQQLLQQQHRGPMLPASGIDGSSHASPSSPPAMAGLEAALQQEVALNMQQAALACAAAKTANERLHALRNAFSNTLPQANSPFTQEFGHSTSRAATATTPLGGPGPHSSPMANACGLTGLPGALQQQQQQQLEWEQQGMLSLVARLGELGLSNQHRTAVGRGLAASPPVLPAAVSASNSGTISSASVASYAPVAVSGPFCTPGFTPSQFQQDDMLLALLLAQQQAGVGSLAAPGAQCAGDWSVAAGGMCLPAAQPQLAAVIAAAAAAAQIAPSAAAAGAPGYNFARNLFV